MLFVYFREAILITLQQDRLSQQQIQKSQKEILFILIQLLIPAKILQNLFPEQKFYHFIFN